MQLVNLIKTYKNERHMKLQDRLILFLRPHSCTDLSYVHDGAGTRCIGRVLNPESTANTRVLSPLNTSCAAPSHLFVKSRVILVIIKVLNVEMAHWGGREVTAE